MAALTGRFLKITVAATEYNTEVFEATCERAKGDAANVTFAEAAAGQDGEYSLKIKLTQDQAAGTLWTKMWESAGTDVAVVVKPAGNASPSAAQPHFTTTATISEPEGVLFGGAADTDPKKRWSIEVEWKCTRPVRVTS